MESAADAVCEPSATPTVKLYVPGVVGEPPITPAGDSASPGGRVPGGTDQVRVPVPPVAVRV